MAVSANYHRLLAKVFSLRLQFAFEVEEIFLGGIVEQLAQALDPSLGVADHGVGQRRHVKANDLLVFVHRKTLDLTKTTG